MIFRNKIEPSYISEPEENKTSEKSMDFNKIDYRIIDRKIDSPKND